MKSRLFIITAACIFLISCTRSNGVYERMAFFPKHEWSSKQKPSFDFEVTDTLATYRIYLVLRHADAYNWSNIWLNIEIKEPDTAYIIRNKEYDLANNKEWYGTVVDDIVDQRIPFRDKANKPVPLKKGKYTFTLQQVMREDPLQHVLNAGIRVEKVE